MSTSAPQSVADTALGFTQSELAIFRQQQQVAQQRAHQSQTADRGRGTSRHSQASSRNASAASSHGAPPGRVVLDPRSLSSLQHHFDNVMRTIVGRIYDLEDATQSSVNASSNRAGRAVQNADAEITRMKRIMADIDKLEDDLESIKHIRDVVKQLRQRVEAMSERLDRSQPSGRSSTHGHSASARSDPRRR